MGYCVIRRPTFVLPPGNVEESHEELIVSAATSEEPSQNREDGFSVTLKRARFSAWAFPSVLNGPIKNLPTGHVLSPTISEHVEPPRIESVELWPSKPEGRDEIYRHHVLVLLVPQERPELPFSPRPVRLPINVVEVPEEGKGRR